MLPSTPTNVPSHKRYNSTRYLGLYLRESAHGIPHTRQSTATTPSTFLGNPLYGNQNTDLLDNYKTYLGLQCLIRHQVFSIQNLLTLYPIFISSQKASRYPLYFEMILIASFGKKSISFFLKVVNL